MHAIVNFVTYVFDLLVASGLSCGHGFMHVSYAWHVCNWQGKTKPSPLVGFDSDLAFALVSPFLKQHVRNGLHGGSIIFGS